MQCVSLGLSGHTDFTQDLKQQICHEMKFKIEISLVKGCEPGLWKTENFDVHFWKELSVLWLLYFHLESCLGYWSSQQVCGGGFRFSQLSQSVKRCCAFVCVILNLGPIGKGQEVVRRASRSGLLSSGSVIRRASPRSWPSAGQSLREVLHLTHTQNNICPHSI